MNIQKNTATYRMYITECNEFSEERLHLKSLALTANNDVETIASWKLP